MSIVGVLMLVWFCVLGTKLQCSHSSTFSFDELRSSYEYGEARSFDRADDGKRATVLHILALFKCFVQQSLAASSRTL
jgi:hypothetical protein